MKFIKILFPILATALATACQTVRVVTDYDPQANFGSYKTFSMYDLKTKGSISELNSERITRFIKSEMLKKGYAEDNNNPDLLVNAVTVLKNKTAIQATSTTYGYGGFYRPYGYWAAPRSGYATVHTYDYKDGSLIVDVVDAKTKKMIWHGVAQSEMDKAPKNPEQSLKSAVERLLKTFPGTD